MASTRRDENGAHLSPHDLEATISADAASAEEFVQRMVAAASARQGGGALPDDLAVVALRRTEA